MISFSLSMPAPVFLHILVPLQGILFKAKLNDPCITRCKGFRTYCEPTTKLCVCRENTTPNEQGDDCISPGQPLLNEPCSSTCVLDTEQTCVAGMCACNEGKRAATPTELHAYSTEVQLQCRELTYTLDECTNRILLEFPQFDLTLMGRTTSAPPTPPQTTPPLTTPATITPPPTSHPTSSPITVPVTPTITCSVELLMPCSTVHGCLDPNASCRQRGCDGLICYCNTGFLPSTYYRSCERVAYVDQSCVTRCSGYFTKCEANVCTCLPGTTKSDTGKDCVLIGRGFRGESCDTTCAIPLEQNCVDHVCTCRSGLRDATVTELQAYFDIPRECRTPDYGLDKCTSDILKDFPRIDREMAEMPCIKVGNDTTAILVAVLGAVIGLLLIGIVTYCVIRYRKSKLKKTESRPVMSLANVNINLPNAREVGTQETVAEPEDTVYETAGANNMNDTRTYESLSSTSDNVSTNSMSTGGARYGDQGYIVLQP